MSPSPGPAPGAAPGVAAVVLAAGSGSRVGADVNKVLLPLADGTVLGRAVATALQVPEVVRVVVVVRPGEEDAVAAALGPVLGEREVLLTTGGASRHASEERALRLLRADVEQGVVDVVAVHDGARPLAPVQLWRDVVAAAREHGGALPTVDLPGLVRADLAPLDDQVLAVQTPQAFRAGPLLAAYDAAARSGFEGTDTASCLAQHATEQGAEPVHVAAVPSTGANLKITFAEDVATAEALLAAGLAGDPEGTGREPR